MKDYKYIITISLLLLLTTACSLNPTTHTIIVKQIDTPTPTDTPKPTVTTTTTTTATRKPTATKTVTPTPTATKKPVASSFVVETQNRQRVNLSETTISLLTYPFKDYLIEQIDPVYNIPVLYLNRIEYERASPTPSPVDYKGVVLENAYLRLIFLPELGGRLYSAIIKSTGQEIFYHNQVVKPSRYGMLQPSEANWWLAVGGMEWAYPTEEHGYRWGVAWQYKVTQNSDGATITLSDTAPGRVGAEVSVTLPVDSALFKIKAKLTNNGTNSVPVQFWLNAALALHPDEMSTRTQFIVPTDKAIVHSRGAEGWTVPDAHTEITWPAVDDTDLSNYSRWANYLGLFMPDIATPFIGAYNPETGLGVVRLIKPGTIPGSKLFAFSTAFPDRSYTDNNSQYFEIWGGANRTFWAEDNISLSSGDSLQWQESWRPIAGLEGISWADEAAVIYIKNSGRNYELSAMVSRSLSGKLIIIAGEKTVLTEKFSANPNDILKWQFIASNNPIKVKIIDDNGTVLLEHK